MRTFRWAVMMIASLVPAICWGQIEIIAPEQVEVGQQFDADVAGLQIKLDAFRDRSHPPQLEWRVIPQSLASLRGRMEVQVAVDPDNGARWVVVPYASVTVKGAGRFGLVLMVVQDGVGSLTVCEIMASGEPNPPPPPPPPPPNGSEIWGAMLFHESHERTPEIAELTTNKALRDWMANQGFKFCVLDKDAINEGGDQAAMLKDYLPVINQLGERLPHVLVVSESGDVIWHGEPTSGADFIQVMMNLLAYKHRRKAT